MASEKRLIDTSQYKSFLKRYIKELYEVDAPMIAGAVERCLYKLEAQPTVDSVEVVRCKDCKSWEQYNACDGTKPHRCMNPYAIFYKRTNPDDFCSYGERKDNERKAD